jgi:hypothetical protein
MGKSFPASGISSNRSTDCEEYCLLGGEADWIGTSVYGETTASIFREVSALETENSECFR